MLETPEKCPTTPGFNIHKLAGKDRLENFAGIFLDITKNNVIRLNRQIRDIASMVEGMLNKYRVPVYDWYSGQGLLNGRQT